MGDNDKLMGSEILLGTATPTVSTPVDGGGVIGEIKIIIHRNAKPEYTFSGAFGGKWIDIVSKHMKRAYVQNSRNLTKPITDKKED